MSIFYTLKILIDDIKASNVYMMYLFSLIWLWLEWPSWQIQLVIQNIDIPSSYNAERLQPNGFRTTRAFRRNPYN